MKFSSERLTNFEKVGFAMGDVGSNLFYMVLVNFGMYFYTDVFCIGAAAVALLFSVTRIFDIVLDPLIGILSDRTNTRWGQYRPYLLWVPVPFGVIATLAFFTPDIGYTHKIVYAWITYFLAGVGFSFVNLPYSALMGVISSDSRERASVSNFRFVGAYAAGLVVNLFTLKLVTFLGGGKSAAEQQIGFTLTMALYISIAVCLFFVTFLSATQRVSTPMRQRSHVGRDLLDAVTNVPWIILLILGIFTLSSVAMRNALIAYYIKYCIWEDINLWEWSFSIEALTGIFLVLGPVGNITGILTIAPVLKKFERNTVYVLLMICTAVCIIPYYYLPSNALVEMFLLQFLSSVFMGPAASLLYAMYTDAADYSEWKTGRRSTGLLMAMSSLAQKLGWSLGGTIGAAYLAFSGYSANVIQSAESIRGIRIMVSWLPALGILIAAGVVYLYPLTNQRMKQIAAELSHQRKNLH